MAKVINAHCIGRDVLEDASIDKITDVQDKVLTFYQSFIAGIYKAGRIFNAIYNMSSVLLTRYADEKRFAYLE